MPPDRIPLGMDMPVELRNPERHEVVKMLDLLMPLGVRVRQPPRMVLTPSEFSVGAARGAVSKFGYKFGMRILAVHISARLSSQRWKSERYVELMHRLHTECGSGFMLFWSPGEETDPRHPGDDQKAYGIIEQCKGLPLLPYPTLKLDELIGGLSMCQAMFCSDGGGMHVGAALGMPIVCMFGNSNANNWHPWGVSHQVLQPPSRRVADVSVEDAYQACRRMLLR